MNRPLAWAGAGALCGLALGAFFAGEAVRALLADHGNPAALDELAHRLRSWVPACTALGLAAGMLARAVVDRPRAPGGARGALALALAAVGVLAWGLAGLAAWRAPSHGDRPPRRPVAEGPNLALVVLDTTRRDRLSLYGYGRPTTPRLERLAESSAVYDRAYSTSSWTCPSHASLFTGRYPLGPGGHGVTQSAWELPPEQVTLAERLRDHGYRTAGIVGNPMVGRRLGFDQGFDEYHETWREQPDAQGRHPALGHLRALLASGDPRPFFVFLNLIEPHSPYTSLGPDAAEFLGPGDPPAPTQNHWRAYYLGRVRFSAEELGHLGDRYDAELRTADGLVGAVVDLLEDAGVLDDTVLVVTADHGEHLGEHGMLDHVFSLYQETVAVPLLVRYPPAFAPGRVERPVQLVDVFTTLAALGGLGPADGQGLDLRPRGASRQRTLLLSYDYPEQALGAIGADAVDPRLDRYRRRLFALVEGDLKVIAGDDGALELYDLAADPRELEDLAERGDPRFEQLVERARAWIAEAELARSRRPAPEAPGQAGVDARTLEELRSLGYAE